MRQEHDLLTIRLCGDSGDGIQLIGEQLMMNAASHGLEVRTLPDFPAEIRAPAGTVSGVSGIQLAISAHRIETAGEQVNILVALNPAALLHSLADLAPGAILFLNECQFSDKDWQKANANSEILEALHKKNQLIFVPMIKATTEALMSLGIPHANMKRCKNFYVLGMLIWLLELSLDNANQRIAKKMSQKKGLIDAAQMAISAGFHYGMIQDWQRPYFLKREEHIQPGEFRQLNGAEAVGLALATIATQSQRRVFVSGYPITPSSVILHECAQLESFGIDLFQAEDEIAAICACLGAAFGGHLAITTTSGPGFDLKMEGIGLGVVAELPLVILDVQRAGASTGLPTKTSQADLRQALYGRHCESPLPVFAATTPSDCFATIIEACRTAIEFMTPVVVLLDAYLMNASEPWLIPDIASLELPEFNFYTEVEPFKRLDNGARSWNPPGNSEYTHQLGGLEKQGNLGKVSYDADNHQKMTDLRFQKIQNIQEIYSPLEIYGRKDASILLIGWGSTFGVLKTVCDTLLEDGNAVAWVHLRHLNPLPKELKEWIHQYPTVLVAELNAGHLCGLLRAEYLVDAQSIHQSNGKPFSTQLVLDHIKKYIL